MMPTRAADLPRADDRLLTPAEAAEVLQVSAFMVRQWARAGDIPAVKVGKFWRFRRSSLETWISDRERGGR